MYQRLYQRLARPCTYNVCVCVCVCVSQQVCVCACVSSMNICRRVCVCVCESACIYAGVCVCVCVRRVSRSVINAVYLNCPNQMPKLNYLN